MGMIAIPPDFKTAKALSASEAIKGVSGCMSDLLRKLAIQEKRRKDQAKIAPANADAAATKNTVL